MVLLMEVDFATVTPLESIQKHLHPVLESTESSGHAICGIHNSLFAGTETLAIPVVSHHEHANIA